MRHSRQYRVDVRYYIDKENKAEQKGTTLKIKSTDWYRPYAIVVNGRGYYLDNIHFYNENGIVVSAGCGWLQEKGYGKDIKEIELPIDEIKLRRKQKFDGVVYAMTHKKEYANETVAELYIPCDMFDIHFVENKLEKEIWCVYKIYEGSHNIYIKNYVMSVDGKLQDIRNEYDKLYENSESFKLGNWTDEIADNVHKMAQLVDEYKAEHERLKSLTIDDITIDDIEL